MLPGPSKAKPIHPADQANLDAIARATSFTWHFRKGYGEVWTGESTDLAEARREAARLDAEHGQFGRRTAIYAKIPGRAAVFVPASYEAAP